MAVGSLFSTVRRLLVVAVFVALAGLALPVLSPALAQEPELSDDFAPLDVAAEPFGLLNGLEPEPGLILGGQPSEAQLSDMAKSGVRTIIDLRRAEEDRGFDEASRAQALGLDYHLLEVGATTLRRPSTFEQFFELLKGAEKPVVVHCASGNRVGALYYAWLVTESSVPREDARRQAWESGLRSEALEAAVDEYLDSREP